MGATLCISKTRLLPCRKLIRVPGGQEGYKAVTSGGLFS